MTNAEELASHLDRLPDEALANLQYHAERGTPICCGANYRF